MCRLLTLLGLALFVSTASAAGTTCKKGNVVHMSAAQPQYYFPSTWNENKTSPELAADQDCSWSVTVPSGYFAKIMIDGKMNGKDSRIQIIDAVGNLLQMTHEKMEPYYFPSPKFTLVVSNDVAATFAFEIVWALMPSQTSGSFGVGSVPHLENATNTIYKNLYGTSDLLSLMVFPEDTHKTAQLRSVLVFEQLANSMNFISNLEMIYKPRQQYISSVSSLALINLEVTNTLDYYLVQEYDLVKNLGDYKVLECNPHSNCTATVNGGSMPSGVVTAPHSNQTLVDVEMDPNANFSVYYGTISNFFFDKKYTAAELKNALPIACSWVSQFVVTSGKAVLHFLS